MTDQQLTAPRIADGDEARSDQDRSETVIREALDVIDGALAKMTQREIVSSGEVADLLLDVRTLLTAPTSRS
jgi:hypothetical protein